ncbi:MAG: hypothetical protein JW816_00395 [Candidatus Buchananbacteria bacterium]|nr:hypothetical protein [Candidatus Buchananbacteria bacterium]
MSESSFVPTEELLQAAVDVLRAMLEGDSKRQSLPKPFAHFEVVIDQSALGDEDIVFPLGVKLPPDIQEAIAGRKVSLSMKAKE